MKEEGEKFERGGRDRDEVHSSDTNGTNKKQATAAVGNESVAADNSHAALVKNAFLLKTISRFLRQVASPELWVSTACFLLVSTVVATDLKVARFQA